MNREILFSTTSAVTAGTHEIAVNGPVTLEATGLGSGETVDIYIPSASGYEAEYVDDEQIQLTPSNKSVRVQGPKYITVAKDVTAGAVTLTRIY